MLPIIESYISKNNKPYYSYLFETKIKFYDIKNKISKIITLHTPTKILLLIINSIHFIVIVWFYGKILFTLAICM
jgi:hypothetical protein